MNKLLENDLYVRLIALFLAVILWLYVVNEHSPQIQRTFTIPIEYVNLSSNLTLLDKEATVEVKITGLNDNVLALDQSQIKAEVDLKGAEEGNYYLPLKISAPFAVKIAEFNPKKVSISLQNIVRKTVNPVLVGKPADGYRIKEVTVVPNAVKVSGENVGKISSLKTMPIDITGIDSNIQRETELILPVGIVALEKKSVKVLLLVEKELKESTDLKENADSDEKEKPES